MAKYGNNAAGLRSWLNDYKSKKSGVSPKKSDVVWDSNSKSWVLSDAFKTLYPNSNGNPTDAPPPSGSFRGSGNGAPVTPNGTYNPGTGVVTPPPTTTPTTPPPGTPGGTPGVEAPPLTPPPSSTPPSTPATPAVNPEDPFKGFDPNVVKSIMGTYDETKKYIDQGRAGAQNAAENRLRDRIGSVAGQQRQAVTNDFVGRGIGSSPVLNKEEALGGINMNEQNAVTSGLIDLDSQYQDKYLSGLNALNSATSNVLGLGIGEGNYENLDAQYGLDTTRLKQDASQFGQKLAFDRYNSDADRKNQMLIAKLVESGKVPAELVDFLKTVMSGLN